MELCLKQMFRLNLQGNYSHSQDEMGGGRSETNKAKQGSWTSQLILSWTFPVYNSLILLITNICVSK